MIIALFKLNQASDKNKSRRLTRRYGGKQKIPFTMKGMKEMKELNY